MHPATNNTLVELHVPDFELAKSFYGKLGFEVVWETKPEGDKGYLVLRLGNCILCFWSGAEEVYDQAYFRRFDRNTKRGYAVEIVVMVEDLDGLYRRAAAFANIVEPLRLRSWGLNDFRIEDPFGFYVRFTELYDIRQATTPGTASGE